MLTNTHTYTYTPTNKHTLLKTIPPSLCYCCAGGNNSRTLFKTYEWLRYDYDNDYMQMHNPKR